MADVTINYKGSAIAEMSGTGNKVLNTSGKYLEGDVEVNYTPRSKTYEITLAKASGELLLTTLDDEVLEHINDENLTVTLQIISAYAFETYIVNMAMATNKQQSSITSSYYPIYGVLIRQSNATTATPQFMYYPANKTDSNNNLGYGYFKVSDGKYYFKPTDGFVSASTYKLTFTW